MSIFDLIDLSGTLLFLSLFVFLPHKKLLLLAFLNLWTVLTLMPFDYPDSFFTPVISIVIEPVDSFDFLFKLFFIFTLNLGYLTYRQHKKVPKKILLLLSVNFSAFILMPLFLTYSKLLPNSDLVSLLFAIIVVPFAPYFGYGMATIPILIATNIIVILILIFKQLLQKKQPKKKKRLSSSHDSK